MDEDSIYKCDDLQEIFESYLSNRCFDNLLTNEEKATKNKESHQKLDTVSSTLEVLINELDHAFQEEDSEYVKIFTRINIELDQPIYSPLEVVISSPLINWTIQEILINTSSAESALNILFSLSFVKKHCMKMIDCNVCEIIPELIYYILNNNSKLMQLLLHLIKADNSVIQYCIEHIEVDIINLLQFLPSQDYDAYIQGQFLILFYTIYKNNTNYHEAVTCYSTYVFQSGFKSAYSPTILLLYSLTKETDYTPLSSQELSEQLVANSVVFMDIINYITLNITKLSDLICDFQIKYYIQLLMNKLRPTNQDEDIDSIMKSEKWISDVPTQVISSKEIKDTELAILAYFFSQIIEKNKIEFDQELFNILFPCAIEMCNNTSFLPKKYGLLLICSILQNFPNEFIQNIDISITIDLFENMFDQTNTSSLINLVIIKTIIILVEIGQKFNGSICESIQQSSIIKEILEFISDFDTDDEENDNEMEEKNLLFDHFVSIFQQPE